jgi:hypothetical protein
MTCLYICCLCLYIIVLTGIEIRDGIVDRLIFFFLIFHISGVFDKILYRD